MGEAHPANIVLASVARASGMITRRTRAIDSLPVSVAHIMTTAATGDDVRPAAAVMAINAPA